MFSVHKDQLDKGGLPYAFHPFEVAEQMDDEPSVCVALLHDVIEDGNITPEYLRDAGFSKEIVEAVKLLSHEKNKPYFSYIKEIKSNPLATKVKLADLKHNSNTARLDVIEEKDRKRLAKYEKAIQELEKVNEKSKNFLDLL